METVYLGNILINDVMLGSQRMDDVFLNKPAIESTNYLISPCGGGLSYTITVIPSVSDLSKVYKFTAPGAPYDTNTCYTITQGGAESGTISTITATFDNCDACTGTTTTTTAAPTTSTTTTTITPPTSTTTTTTTAAPTSTTTTTDGTTTTTTAGTTTTTTAGTTTTTSSTTTTTSGTTTTTASPSLYYFQVTECGGTGTTDVSSTTNMTIGGVYKLITQSSPPQTQFDGTRCWQIITTAIPGGTAVAPGGSNFGDCSTCNATTTTTTFGTTTTTEGTTTTTTSGTTTTTAGTTTTTTDGTTTTTTAAPTSTTTTTEYFTTTTTQP
jgi:hypothetical protein